MDAKLQKLVDELFSLLGVKATASVSQEDDVYKVTIETEESGLLIGGHGTTLFAIESFLAVAMKQETGEWVKIVVDIAGWRNKQEDYLNNLAIQAAERAKSTGESQKLYNLTPAQRRIIHMKLAEDKEIKTESEGEGEERYLVITAK